jgi:hypothetical protein
VVKKMLEKQPPKAITVYVDMKDVDQAAKKVCACSFKGNCCIIQNFLLCYRKVHLETQRIKVMMEGNPM